MSFDWSIYSFDPLDNFWYKCIYCHFKPCFPVDFVFFLCSFSFYSLIILFYMIHFFFLFLWLFGMLLICDFLAFQVYHPIIISTFFRLESHTSSKHFFFLHFFKKCTFNWSLIALQKCCSAMKQCESAISIHMFTSSWTSHPTPTPHLSMLSQSIIMSSLCYTTTPH